MAGSSPRGRGTVCRRSATRRRVRFIPAWAGNSCWPVLVACWPPVHPRVGGEQGIIVAIRDWDVGSSPRGRGTAAVSISAASGKRFIPAWAGNSNAPRRQCRAMTVHPRVGGEQGHDRRKRRLELGSSPRGRGTGSNNNYGD